MSAAKVAVQESLMERKADLAVMLEVTVRLM